MNEQNLPDGSWLLSSSYPLEAVNRVSGKRRAVAGIDFVDQDVSVMKNSGECIMTPWPFCDVESVTRRFPPAAIPLGKLRKVLARLEELAVGCELQVELTDLADDLRKLIGA